MRIVALLVGMLVVASGCVDAPPSQSVEKAIAYLVAQQRDDGGFASQPGGSSELTTSAWAALAFGAGGSSEPANAKLRAYLSSQAAAVASNTTGSFSASNAAALFVLAGAALGDPDTVFAGTNPVARLRHDAANASLGFNEKLFVMAALGRMGPAPDAAALVVEVKRSLDEPNHEFVAKDAWFRAHAILALIAAGEDDDSDSMRRWARSLLPFQQADAGFRGSVEYPPDASTTAAVVAVLSKVQFVYSHERETGSEFMTGLQEADGSVKFSHEIDFARTKTTAEAVLGWTGKGPFAA